MSYNKFICRRLNGRLLPVSIFPYLVLALVTPLTPAAQAAGSPNRTLPHVETPLTGLHFSSNPSEAEIFMAQVFDEPLVPIGGKPTPAENAALAVALGAHAQRTSPDQFSNLTGFLAQHPESPWRAALLTGLGLEYYQAAYYSRALEAWREAWALGQQASDAKGNSWQIALFANSRDCMRGWDGCRNWNLC